MDLNIRVNEEGSWELRSKRLEILKAKETPEFLEHSIQLPNHRYIDPELDKALKEGNADNFIDALEQVSKKLSLSAILNQAGPAGDTLLHIAARFHKQEIVQLIAYHFSSIISRRNVIGDTVLHVAAKAGMLNTVEVLVCCAKDFPGADISGSSSSKKDSDGLLWIKNVHGNTALHEAVMHHRHDVVLFLISADPTVWYCQNTVGWSPLYMAVRVNDMQMLRLLLQAPIEHRDALTRLEGNSPAHAAVLVEDIDMLKEMATMNPELIRLKDGRGRNVLHLAAYGGDDEAVRFISRQFRWSMFEMNNKGFLPIHIASKKGHVEIVKELFNQWPYPKELLNREGQSILHIAAKSGRNNVVKYILKTPMLKKKLLNTTDINGNTPLHLAAMHSHPAVVLTLTWQNEIEINLLNNESFTPFDVSPKFFSKAPRGQYNLTNSALWSAGALPSFDAKIQKQKEKTSKSRKEPEIEWVKERVGMLLVKETLVATATFAATFTVPGGYNSSENPEKGIATMLNNRMFLLFVVCNTIAFYSSIISIFSMLWTTTSDYFVVCRAYSFSQNLFVFALGMMSMAFMAAIHVAVSKVSWLAYSTVILGIISLAILVLMFTAFEFPLGHSPRFMRCISYYISYAIIPLLGDYDELPIDKAEESEHNEQEKLRKDEQQESLSEEKMRN